MPPVNKRIQKKRGRGRPAKPGGLDPILSARVPKEMAAEIQARADREGVPRSEALVKIIAEGLGKALKKTR